MVRRSSAAANPSRWSIAASATPLKPIPRSVRNARLVVMSSSDRHEIVMVEQHVDQVLAGPLAGSAAAGTRAAGPPEKGVSPDRSANCFAPARQIVFAGGCFIASRHSPQHALERGGYERGVMR